MAGRAALPTAGPTNHAALSLLVGAGTFVAVQVGKVTIATPMLQAEFGLGLDAIGWLAAIFALLGLVGGIPAGAVVASFGARGILVLGLLITGTGAAIGAAGGSFPVLLVSRMIEGAGFLLVIIAAPALIERVVARENRDFAFALWSCFMPAGLAIAMLAGPLFENWRVLWWSGSVIMLTLAMAVVFTLPTDRQRSRWSTSQVGADAKAVIKAPGPIALATGFALYSLMFFALFSFIPVLLMERIQVTHDVAGLLSALATAANIVGNLAAGMLLSRGVSAAWLLGAANTAMGLTALGIFLPVLPEAAVFVLCVVFSAIGGLIPATLLSGVPRLTPGPLLAPVVFGLAMQGSNLGQVVGPIAVGTAIQLHGWPSAAAIVAIAAIMGAATAALIGRQLRAGSSSLSQPETSHDA